MKIKKIGEPTVIMSNPLSKHNYFAWPSAERLQNGRIAVGASGYRLRHVCPFGKSVLSFSENEGETYTAPAPIIDTVLDDRDVGLCPFGESGLIFTSFNNSTDFQRTYLDRHPEEAAYRAAYLDTVTKEEQDAVLGVTFRISHDCGVTFGPLYRAPVTSPHGPVELADGTILWVGRVFERTLDRVVAYALDPENGEFTFRGAIENIEDFLSCEPHAIQLKDGSLLCQIRVQNKGKGGSKGLFTIYQSRSTDGGFTWTTPVPVLEPLDGAPPHLLQLMDGTLICTYGHRDHLPYGIRVMVSTDGGQHWETNLSLYENNVSSDLGYPATVILKDGSLLTVFYAHPEEGPAVILQQKWRLEQ